MVDASRPIPRLESRKSPDKSQDRHQVAAYGQLEPPVTDRQHLQGVQESQDHVGQELANHQFPGADWGDDQLFNGAPLSFTHDRCGGEDRGQGIQDNADHAGDHKVGADQVGVVPDLGAHFDR